jgi:2,4-dienoyl-CoA reductase-like NADH-dependent reductase (Old Yellow Enzyme family)
MVRRIVSVFLLMLTVTDTVFIGLRRGTPHDELATYGPFLTNTHIFLNSGVTPDEAEELVESGKVAGVFFGLSWIAHPDVGKRLKAGKPLDNAPDVENFYGKEGVDPALGYLDYKAAM